MQRRWTGSRTRHHRRIASLATSFANHPAICQCMPIIPPTPIPHHAHHYASNKPMRSAILHPTSPMDPSTCLCKCLLAHPDIRTKLAICHRERTTPLSPRACTQRTTYSHTNPPVPSRSLLENFAASPHSFHLRLIVTYRVTPPTTPTPTPFPPQNFRYVRVGQESARYSASVDITSQRRIPFVRVDAVCLFQSRLQ